MAKPLLRSLVPAELGAVVTACGGEAYRARQLAGWLFEHDALEWDELRVPFTIVVPNVASHYLTTIRNELVRVITDAAATVFTGAQLRARRPLSVRAPAGVTLTIAPSTSTPWVWTLTGFSSTPASSGISSARTDTRAMRSSRGPRAAAS